MKSQFDVLLSVADELLSEARLACGYQEEELERDRTRLFSVSKSLGLEFFTLVLPSLDSLLLQGLEVGKLSTSGPLSRVRSKVDRRPRFLWGLWSQVFDASGSLNVEIDPNAILYLRQILCLGKRLQLECAPGRVKAVLENYRAIESRIIPPRLAWDEDDLGYRDSDLSFTNSFGLPTPTALFREPKGEQDHEIPYLLRVLDFTSRALVAFLGEFNPQAGEETYQDGKFKHGPGAVADARSSHFKYEFPTWPRKLEGVFHYDWCGSHTLVPETFPSEHEPPSVIHAVPKTAKGPRLIAAEPIAHQWCQQKVASWLRESFDRTLVGRFIDLRDQTLSQKMVKEASITKRLATLDLSDASDRLSCRHVESLLRGNKSLLEACHAVRTRWVVDRVRSDVPPEFLKLKKFAAQGSALTFPIQSLFFLACCLAACRVSSLREIRALEGSVRVYGDDLIVPAHACARLKVLLTHLGLKVNVEKSFVLGEFRESCGMDCWRGFDITPLRPKTFIADAPERCQAVIDTSNNFYKRGFWRVSSYLDSTVLAPLRVPVTHIDSGVPGLQSYSGTDVSTVRYRWNKGYQRWEIRCPMLVNKGRRKRQDTSATLLQYFTEEPDPSIHWESGVAQDLGSNFVPRWVDAGGLAP